MGDPNIVLMCLIFLLAGAFAYVSKAAGAVDAIVGLGVATFAALAAVPRQDAGHAHDVHDVHDHHPHASGPSPHDTGR